MGLAATGALNLGFPIDFDSRPYNSVMRYHATLWWSSRLQTVLKSKLYRFPDLNKWTGNECRLE